MWLTERSGCWPRQRRPPYEDCSIILNTAPQPLRIHVYYYYYYIRKSHYINVILPLPPHGYMFKIGPDRLPLARTRTYKQRRRSRPLFSSIVECDGGRCVRLSTNNFRSYNIEKCELVYIIINIRNVHRLSISHIALPYRSSILYIIYIYRRRTPYGTRRARWIDIWYKAKRERNNTKNVCVCDEWMKTRAQHSRRRHRKGINDAETVLEEGRKKIIYIYTHTSHTTIRVVALSCERGVSVSTPNYI